jgi:NAD(P)-dependent dehydrogenase (short-subunit alcohol dehydrogenase family)
MRNSPEKPRFIINVSAMEGQFYRFKSSDHPHTNMAKASLNMMTRTVGGYYSTFDIYMNSVDTGWVTLENPGNY